MSLNGWPEKATVSLWEKKLITPFTYHELKKGRYKLRIRKDGYKSKSMLFKITAQKLLKLEYKLSVLDRSIARKRSAKFPGLGHFYAERYTRGLFWMALEGTALYSTSYMYLEFKKWSNKYNSANIDYLAATEESDIIRKFNQMEECLKLKNAFKMGMLTTGAISIGVWIWNIVDAGNSIPPVFDIPKKSNVDIGINSKGELEAHFAF